MRHNDTKTILFINGIYPPDTGASARVLKDLARAFVTKGWKVTVLSVVPSKQDALKVPSTRGIDYVPVICDADPRKISGIFKLLMKLKKVGCKLPRHDLVVSMTDPPMLIHAGNHIAAKMDAKHIHWCQDLYPDLIKALDYPMPGWMYKLCFKSSRRLMKRADRVIAIGRCMARHLKRTGVDPSRISVIPNWADLVLYRRPDKKPEKSKDEETSDKFRLLYAGNLGKAHPYEAILSSLKTLNRTHDYVEFAFAGHKENFNPIDQAQRELKLENITFLPYQPLPKLQTLLKGADVHIVTMSEAAQGMLVPCKFYSALAAARPCIFIGPEDSEIGVIINDFECGVIVSPDKPEDLTQAIKTYLENPEIWFKHQEGAYKAAQTLKPSHSINAWITRAENTLKTI